MSTDFTIGDALAEYDRIACANREAERDERPTDPLASYARTLSTGAHPPNECGDWYGCPSHGDQYRAYMEGRG